MFERYTERARRVIFFARYEASAFGSPYIEIEHMLLGLVRECALVKGIVSHGAAEALRAKLRAEQGGRERISTSVDLPLSPESKRMLALGAEEAELRNHRHVDCDHLFAGLLRLPPGALHGFLAERVGDPEKLLQQVRDRLQEEPVPHIPSARSRPGLTMRWIADALRATPAAEFARDCWRLSAILERSSELSGSPSEEFGDATISGLSWTRKQALGKLIDWASQYRLWIAQALTAETLHAGAFPSDAAVLAQRYDQMRWQSVVESWLSANCLLLRAIASLPGSKTSLPCRIGSDEPVTLGQLLSRFVEMAEELIGQVSSQN
jgi:hypothetical protein